MRSAILRASGSDSAAPVSSATPTSAAKRRPASSMRTTRRSASSAITRAPTSMAVISGTSPFSHTAIFEVPPPMSMFITRALSRIERDAAPEPKAASVVSSPSPGRNRHELAGLGGEQLADGAGVGAPHGDAGQDQRAGVDLVRRDARGLVLRIDECAELVGVDRHVGGVGREQDVGFVEHLALGDDVAVVEPLQQQAREHEVRCR